MLQVIIQIEEEVEENFADGKKKGKSPGRVKRSGASCKGPVTDLRAKAKKYSGERGKMYWCANMKSGKKKKNEFNGNQKNLTQSLYRKQKNYITQVNRAYQLDTYINFPRKSRKIQARP